MQTRRTLLKHSAAILASSTLARPAFAITTPHSIATVEDPRLKQLVTSAVNAAIDAGASYADARLTHQEGLGYLVGVPNPSRQERMEFGVRALYQGYWGFASSPIWMIDEAVRLGKAATTQARVNVLGTPRNIELAPLEAPRSGEWVMPVKDDPFKIAPEEIDDFLQGLKTFSSRLEYYSDRFSASCRFGREQKVFCNSLGQYTIQHRYRVSGNLSFLLSKNGRSVECRIDDYLTVAGMGFEYLRDRPIRQYILDTYEEVLRDLELPVFPVEPGRYTTLISQMGVARLVGQSIGVATQIDRAMGYEANAEGTSYITDPENMVGTLKVGNSLVNVTGDRSEPGSVGRVAWDDEGVEPIPFVLIKDGILTNFQTNREGCGWIKDHYVKTNQPLRSFGCAEAASGLEVPLIFNADLTLQPSPDHMWGLDSLRETIDRGIEYTSPELNMDFQQVTGFMQGKAYEIRKGKRTALLLGCGTLFRTPEVWNNLAQLGGNESVRRFGLSERKGEPRQYVSYSVTAPPAIFKEMTTIDVKRKA